MMRRTKTQKNARARARLGARARAVPVLAGVIVLVTGCTALSTDDGLGAEPTLWSTEQATAITEEQDLGHEPAHSHEHRHDEAGPGEPMHDMDGSNPGIGVWPTWQDADQQAALERGREAMEAFTRTDVAEVEWLEAMLVFTAPQARENFAHIDPANIAASHVEDVELAQVSTASMAQVIVQTDGPNYVVTMTRLADGQPWLVQRISLGRQ